MGYNNIMNKNKGFTLLEVLIYTGIMAIVGNLLSGLLVFSTKIQGRQTASIEVNTQLSFALQNIQRAVIDSSLIDIENDVSTSTLVLRFKDESQNPTKIYIENDKLVKQIASNPPQPITNDSVIANKVIFLKVSGYSGHDSLQVELALSYNTTNPDYSFFRSLTSATARVSAAIFDSNLIPGSNNYYDIGLNSTKWKDMYLSGSLYASENVDIGGDVNLAGDLNSDGVKAMLFGGWYCVGTGTASGSSNPLTGGQSCPTGFSATSMFSTGGIKNMSDQQVSVDCYICYK